MPFLSILLQLPCMEPFPGPRSVMLIDNCSTHKSNAVRDAVEASGTLCTSCLLRLLLTQCIGCRYIFLPAYSPDYSPIEESFSCCKLYILYDLAILKLLTNLSNSEELSSSSLPAISGQPISRKRPRRCMFCSSNSRKS